MKVILHQSWILPTTRFSIIYHMKMRRKKLKLLSKDNYIVSTLSSDDISRLYNMNILTWHIGEPMAIIQESLRQIKTELEHENKVNELCIILRLQSSVDIHILNLFWEISDYLERKNIISNFAITQAEKLYGSEFQLITLIN